MSDKMDRSEMPDDITWKVGRTRDKAPQSIKNDRLWLIQCKRFKKRTTWWYFWYYNRIRLSEDDGQSYGDKINLSNSSESNSTDFDIEATNNKVIVRWWETNSTSAEPVIIFSNDHGATFGRD